MGTVKLIDLFESNISGEWGSEPYGNENDVEIIRSTNFSDDIRFKTGSEIVTRNVESSKLDSKKLQYGDIIVEKSGGSPTQPVGRILYYDFNDQITRMCNNFTSILRPTDNNDSKYLAYLLLSLYQRGAVLKFQNKTTGIINLKLKDYLESTRVSIPPLETQKKIVEALDKAQKLIDARKEQIRLMDELVKSRFVEVFGDPNDVNSKWEKIKLGDLCTIVRGGSPRPIENFLGGNIPWIKIGDATQGDDIYLHSTKEHIIEEGIKKSRYIKKNSMIFANCGVSLGFARIITFDGCIHDGWLAFHDIDSSLNNIFLLKSLNMCTDYFRKTAPDGTQPNLNTGIMKTYNQIVPPLELQNEFVEFFKYVDKSKSELQTNLNELIITQQALMQQYFG